MRAAIYARISSDPEDQRAGVERQESRGAEIAARHGWVVAATYRDNDASGFKEKARRPGFDALRAAIEAGQVEVVVVQHQDRLARNVPAFRSFADLCRDHDVRIETWSGPIDTNSATGRMTSTVQAAVDEHYSAILSEKITAAAAEIAQRGEPNGGRRPFGYQRSRRDDGTRTFTPDPTEAPIVGDMFDAFNRGVPLRSIAADLDSRGFRTAGGSRWSTGRVRDVLTNPLYIGKRVHRGDVIGDGNWPDIVNRAVFNRAQRTLRDPHRRTSPGGPRRYYLSGGIARCGRCGAALISGRNKGRRLYRCPAPLADGCGRLVVDADGLEGHVASAILEALADPRIEQAIAATATAPADYDERLADLEHRRGELAEAFAAGEIDRAQLAAGTARLRAQADELDAAATEADRPAMLTGLLRRTDLPDLWDAQPAEWQHRVAATLLEAVTVAPAVRGWNFFDPGRVALTWAG